RCLSDWSSDVCSSDLTRALRGFADGAVSVLLASYLSTIGYTPVAIGAIVTGTLLGSAALSLAAGLLGHRLGPRKLLLAASALMRSEERRVGKSVSLGV